MSKRIFRKQFRSTKKWVKKNPHAAIVIILLIAIVSYTAYMQNRRLVVDPATYQPLLQLIARVESKENDNAYFGNAHNTSIDFTNMSVAEVMRWQKDFVQQGNASSAVGRYQIIDTTLAGLVRELGIDAKQRFDRALQDKMAIALIERRGAEKYINGELTRDEFAANLAKEWAALPKVIGENPQQSYYAGDGLNKALVGIEEVQKAIEPIDAK